MRRFATCIPALTAIWRITPTRERHTMPTIPAKWRKYLYVVSIAAIPVLVLLGWVRDELEVALSGLAYAVFIGGMAAKNTPKDTDG
jgi:hypothetical protein